MVRIITNPHPHSKALDQKFSHHIILVMVVLLALAAAIWYSQTKNWFTAIFGLSVGGLLVIMAEKVFKQMDKNDQGADGEYEIKKLLTAELSDFYTLFQNVPIADRLDIDFVLIGPIGVIAIEVKSHRRFLKFGNRDFVGQTQAEVMKLKSYLKQNGVDVYVQGVLVFSRAFVKTTTVRGVVVTNKKYLTSVLGRVRQVRLDQARVERLIQNLYR